MDNYDIQLENFEGPLDLLLHLIKKNEMDINDIPHGSNHRAVSVDPGCDENPQP